MEMKNGEVLYKDIVSMTRVCDTCDSTNGVEELVVSHNMHEKTMHLCKACSEVLIKHNLNLYKKQ